jgi:peptide/nickel transport system permease protein
MAWQKYTAQRLLQIIPIMIGVSIVVFLLIHIVPGDPARTLLGPQAHPEAVAALRVKLGLDRPLAEQYFVYVWGLLRGDLGQSLNYNISVAKLMANRWQPTIWLIINAAILVIIITVPLALAAARRPGGIADGVVRIVALLGLGLPSFWIGMLLILSLGIKVNLFPVSGYGVGFTGHIYSMLLPSLTVAFSIAPITIRSLRMALIEAFDSEPVLATKAKGLSPSRTTWYALRIAILPAVTVLGVNLGWLVGNTVVIEQLFGIPGLGSLMIESIFSRDFPSVQIVALVFATLVVLVSLITDLTRAALDPRIELG